MATVTLQVPAITEDNLLAFQISHFGDDTQPGNWFVEAETALQYAPLVGEADDDDLGYYEDGTKRTLTDEQIAMFRHSEIEQLLRKRKLQRDEVDYQNREAEGEEHAQQAPRSPASDVSSLEDDLVGLARPAPPKPARRPPPKRQTSSDVGHSKPSSKRQPSQNSHSDTPKSTESARRPRREEVPYDQRHKRKWEDFIDESDPIEGSLTHRRIVRQLDEQRESTLDIDYGEDVARSQQKAPVQPPPGRRVVSYEDD